MKIETLRIKSDNGEEIVESLNLLAGLGIEGDKKAKGGDRQLALADYTKLKEYRENGKGLCVRRFMPNIATNGIDYETINPGDRFQIGNVIIEISSTDKKCFDECPYVKDSEHCEIKKNCAFAKIVDGGTIRTGDEIVEG